MGRNAENMTNRIKALLLAIIIFFVVINIPLATKQGINGTVRVLKIPLYVKAMEYLDRNYQYKALVKEITARHVGEKEKVIAIFNWVIENIHRPPKGFDIIDDHVLNIIIRRYGSGDQMADVFTTLCVYAGVPAFWRIENPDADTLRIVVSYVKLDGRWRIFDVSRKIFFDNNKNDIASVEDVITDISIVRKKGITLRGRPYEDYFKNLQPIKKNFISKEQKQMPSFRIIYEIRRIFGRY